MGSDDLFHRKARSPRDLKRNNTSRKSPYDKILIVCEGKKTEKLYFESLIRKHNLSTVTVRHEGSAPISVVNGAVKLFEENKNKNKNKKINEDPYDKIYCVFDQDNHDSFKKAIDKIHTLNNGKKFKNKIFPIISVRQFEFWLLLHFQPTAKPFNNGDDLIRELKKHEFMRDYEKGTVSYYEKLGEDRYLKAKIEAERINSEHKQNKSDDSYANPSTNVYKLTEVLRNMRRQSPP